MRIGNAFSALTAEHIAIINFRTAVFTYHLSFLLTCVIAVSDNAIGTLSMLRL